MAKAIRHITDKDVDNNTDMSADNHKKVASQHASYTIDEQLYHSIQTKENTVTNGTSSQYYRGDKTMQSLNKGAVGLGNIDNTSDTSKPVSTATQAALDDKAGLVHAHPISDITNLQTRLNEKLMFYLAGTLKSNAKMQVVTATTSSGSVVFNLTTNNSPTGTALFTNVYLDAVQVEAYSTAAVLLFGIPTLAGDKKTISFSVNQVTAVLLGLLNIVTASNGITARLMIVGD